MFMFTRRRQSMMRSTYLWIIIAAVGTLIMSARVRSVARIIAAQGAVSGSKMWGQLRQSPRTMLGNMNFYRKNKTEPQAEAMNGATEVDES